MKRTEIKDLHSKADLERGFSVVEVLLAAAVLLIVTIGILPLFTRAISSNVQGQQLTEAVHRAKSEMETMIQADFNGELMTVEAGDRLSDGTDGKETVQFWSSEQKAWVDESELGTDELKTFVRTTRVRQFGIQELRENPSTKDWTPKAGGSADSEIHLKEIEVVVTTAEAEQSSVFGPFPPTHPAHYQVFLIPFLVGFLMMQLKARYTDRTRAGLHGDERGFSLMELIVGLFVMAEVLVVVLLLFDVNNKISRVQTSVSDIQQSQRIAQHDIGRFARMAGRGGLPRSVAIVDRAERC